MKKILSLVLALSMVLGMFSFAFATTLKDVEGTKYAGPVEALVELGVVNGYKDGTFQSDKVVTRAEMAKMLVICLGQESAAELAKGSTKFADVAADHWAAGYINVASQNNVIVGYPDGTFNPEATVSYAEAVTMAVRALGYRNVVETAGTWPTNYMTKAVELKLLNDMGKVSGGEGAARGNVAILMWNMLRTNMWVILQENQTNGVTYGEGDEMLNIKFPDYTYADDMVFLDWYYEVEKEGKLYVEIASKEDVENVLEDADTYAEAIENVDGVAYEYAKNDFYKLVPGTEVEVLYNNEDKEILSIVPTEDNVLVEGFVSDLEKDYTNYNASEGATYAYLLLSANKKSAEVLEAVEIFGNESRYVAKVEEKANYTKITLANGASESVKRIEEDNEEDVLVIDGEKRCTLADVEVGDIVTLITEDVAILCRDTKSGTFESLTHEETSDDVRFFIELDGEEYEGLAGLTVVSVDEDDEEEFIDVDPDVLGIKKNDYLEEDATLYFNFIGEVVRMAFGVVDASEVKGDFFLMTTGKTWSVADEDGAVWYVKLANEDGAKSYVIDEDYEAPVNEEGTNAGKFYWVEFNDDDEIKNMTVVDGTGIESAEDFDFASFDDEMNKDTSYIENTYKVSKSTKVFSAREILDDDNMPTGRYELVVTTGSKELEGIDEGKLALENGSIRVAYAFVKGESTSSDKDFGIVEKVATRKGLTYVTVNGESYEVASEANKPAAGSIIAYTINSNEKLVLSFEYEVDELDETDRVTKVDDTLIKLESGASWDLDLIEEYDYDDYRAFLIEIGYDSNDNPVFEEIEEVDVNDMDIKKNDCLAITKTDAPIKAIAIIRGLEKITY